MDLACVDNRPLESTAQSGILHPDIDDLADILEAMEEVAVHYSRIATALRLRNSDVKIIEKQYRHDPKDGLSAVLEAWLNLNTIPPKNGIIEQPSWYKVVEVVGKSWAGNNHALAKKIAANHPLGQAPTNTPSHPLVDDLKHDVESLNISQEKRSSHDPQLIVSGDLVAMERDKVTPAGHNTNVTSATAVAGPVMVPTVQASSGEQASRPQMLVTHTGRVVIRGNQDELDSPSKCKTEQPQSVETPVPSHSAQPLSADCVPARSTPQTPQPVSSHPPSQHNSQGQLNALPVPTMGQLTTPYILPRQLSPQQPHNPQLPVAGQQPFPQPPVNYPVSGLPFPQPPLNYPVSGQPFPHPSVMTTPSNVAYHPQYGWYHIQPMMTVPPMQFPVSTAHTIPTMTQGQQTPGAVVQHENLPSLKTASEESGDQGAPSEELGTPQEEISSEKGDVHVHIPDTLTHTNEYKVLTDRGKHFTEYNPYPPDKKFSKIRLTCSLVEPEQTQLERYQVPEDEKYRMRKFPHGIAVIINNKTFKHHNRRDGTDVDSRDLVLTFRYLGYVVHEYKDLTADQILDVFERIRNQDHSNYDSFICCILSHGENGVIYGTDSHKVQITHLTYKLRADACPTLSGVPKLFFIQACRGPLESGSVQVDGGRDSLIAEDDQPEPIAYTDAAVAKVADFFVGYSTSADYVSFRDANHGSWYVWELCDALCNLSTCRPLRDIMDVVHQKVNAEHSYRSLRQAPNYSWSLRKKVFFW